MATKKTSKKGFFLLWYHQIIYSWQNVYNDIYRHRFAGMLTVIVIAISIMLPTVCYLLWKNANGAAKQWSPSPNLTVYLQKDQNQQQIAQLKATILRLDAVKKIDYRSRKQNLEEFRTWSGFNDALDLLNDNPLPDLIIVIPTSHSMNTTALYQLQKNLIALNGVDDVRLDDTWFKRLTALTGLIASIVWALSVLMLIAVFLVIGNNIRLMVFARRQTILVLQLIGATEGFILRPFLYSGIFHGFISAILALILSNLFIFQIDSIILQVSSVFGTTFKLRGLSWEESLFITLLAIIIGWLSALLATKKYLQIAEK